MEEKKMSGFIWYELMANDLDKAVTFYSEVVGWDVRDSGMPGMRYMLFGKGGKDVGGMMSRELHGPNEPRYLERPHLHAGCGRRNRRNRR